MHERMGLEEETFDSIMGDSTWTGPRVFACGCEYRKVGTKPDRHRWFICSYHEGMEAGIEIGEQRGR